MKTVLTIIGIAALVFVVLDVFIVLCLSRATGRFADDIYPDYNEDEEMEENEDDD